MGFGDWLIILIYMVSVFMVGFFLRKKASENMASYFTASRALPWWLIGTSMVATTFAADTPLAITGIIAKDGIAGNWFWWSWVFTFAGMTVFFSKTWQRSGILTDVELCELRYEGKSAAFLRGFKALYLGIVINGIILGWVFKAMTKISDVFIDWQGILGKGFFSAIQNYFPDFLMIGSMNNTLTVILILIVVTIYSSQGGIRGVIFTDLFQFFLGFAGAIVFAYYAVHFAGGMEAVIQKLQVIYHGGQSKLSYFPDLGHKGSLPLEVFLIFIGMIWWTKYFSDGSGYFAQRLNSARSSGDAFKGSLWFTFAHFVLRTWPWVVCGLVALVIYPVDNPAKLYSEGAKLFLIDGSQDRELAYPLLMLQALPAGVLGFCLVGLIAAFMSTVDTHLNWGASYLINDVYKRFMNPAASQKNLVMVSRLSIPFLALMAVLVSSQITSIEKAWKFFIAIASGAGLPQLLRWFWYRANAYTEISGMATALIMSVALHALFPAQRQEYLLFFIAITSVTISIIVTLITKPSSEEVLKKFYDKVAPSGWWGSVDNGQARKKFFHLFLLWILISIFIFLALFALGDLVLFGKLGIYALSLLILTAITAIVFRMYLKTNKIDFY